MENVNKQVSFQFVDYVIEKAEINISDRNIGGNIKFSIDPDGYFDKEKKEFVLSLSVLIKDAEDKFSTSFMMKGFFKYESIEFEKILKFIGTNAPAILFPYIRGFVSNITSLSGMQPVIMPTLNMQPVGEDLVNKLKSKSED